MSFAAEEVPVGASLCNRVVVFDQREVRVGRAVCAGGCTGLQDLGNSFRQHLRVRVFSEPWSSVDSGKQCVTQGLEG